MTNIKPKKWRYKASKKARQHISKWEGTDFEKQNKQFGGDAIAAKEKEFSILMGDRGKYFTQDELDGMFSTYYNLKPSTFNDRFMGLIDNYVNDTSNDNLNMLKYSMLSRYNLSKKEHKRGIRNRAAADVALMGDSSYRLPDSNTVVFPRMRSLKHVPDNTFVKPVQQPIEILPRAAKTQPTQLVADNRMTQQNVWDIFDRGATAYGHQQLQMLPSFGDMIADNKNKYFADMLGLSSIYDTGNLNYEFTPFMIA